ncbi:MAG: carbohydrate-binding domain-containing protein, partial [Oscillospiraceae bacterium]|nr:carbohydrate-binding domain-containing protein [Oscillospiraceae bacterium]
MKKTFVKTAAAAGLCLSILACSLPASAAFVGAENNTLSPELTQSGQSFSRARDLLNGQMVISEPGQYTLTGEMRGTVYVDPGDGGVRLVLDGAGIDGAGGPAIVAVSGSRLDISLAEGSVNRMRSGAESSFGAALYSEVPVSFEGSGRLDIRSQGPAAIRVGQGDLSFNGGDIRIEAGQNGLDAQNINFNSGAVSVSAALNMAVPSANINMNGGAFSEIPVPAASSASGQSGSASGGSRLNIWVPNTSGNSQLPGLSGGNQQQNNSQLPGFPGGNQQQSNGQQPGFPSGEQRQSNGQLPGFPGGEQQQTNSQLPGFPGGEQ